MATRKTSENSNRSNELAELLEPGAREFRDFSDMIDSLSGEDESISQRRLNLTAINQRFGDSDLRDYAEPESVYDVCYITSGVGSPEEVDLESLRTSIGLAVVSLRDTDYVGQDHAEGEKVTLGGETHYVLPVDQRGKDYMGRFHSK